MKVKKDIEEIFERIEKSDKGLQNYIANQLKNVWTYAGEIKKRVENIEEQSGFALDQSFVY
jgi:hypothetical protein